MEQKTIELLQSQTRELKQLLEAAKAKTVVSTVLALAKRLASVRTAYEELTEWSSEAYDFDESCVVEYEAVHAEAASLIQKFQEDWD